MIIKVDLKENGYDIVFEHGALKKAGEYMNLNRKVLVVSDSGVPAQYAETVAAQAKEGHIVTIPQGEASKNLGNFQLLLEKMLEYGFARKDAVVAVGGGVCGDLAGFVAACFMRGVDFYNIPTTVLSQVDSSIGGKTAVDLAGIKNIVGAFYQPKKVLIDPDVLKTLPDRQISNGLSESVKMALTSNKELFELFEKGSITENLDEIISASINIKREVVEKDEKETGLRKILNFGHTIGHGVESEEELNKLYHGECVAIGMIPMVSDELRPRLLAVLKKLNLPTSVKCDVDKVVEAMAHDKKSESGKISVTLVNEPGSFVTDSYDLEQLRTLTEMITE